MDGADVHLECARIIRDALRALTDSLAEVAAAIREDNKKEK